MCVRTYSYINLYKIKLKNKITYKQTKQQQITTAKQIIILTKKKEN